jgi:hypothetical protein
MLLENRNAPMGFSRVLMHTVRVLHSKLFVPPVPAGGAFIASTDASMNTGVLALLGK